MRGNKSMVRRAGARSLFGDLLDGLRFELGDIFCSLHWHFPNSVFWGDAKQVHL